MFSNLSGAHLLILLLVILLVFGAPKLPGLAKSLGQSMKILKKEVRELADEEQSQPVSPVAPQAASQQPVSPVAPQAAQPQVNPAAANEQQPPQQPPQPAA